LAENVRIPSNARGDLKLLKKMSYDIRTFPYSLFPCARTGPILTSLRAGCKMNDMFKEFVCIVTSQIV